MGNNGHRNEDRCGSRESSKSLLSTVKRCVASLINKFDYEQRELDQIKLKELKCVIRYNAAIIDEFVEELLKLVHQQNCDRRLAIVLIVDEFFRRSHAFRVKLISCIQDFLTFTAETDPLHFPLPTPRDAANALKISTLKLFKQWHEKYSLAYPKLEHAYQLLRSSKAFDFEHVDAQLEAERNRSVDAERSRLIRARRIIDEVSKQFAERREDIQGCIVETRSALELIFPRFEVDEGSSAALQRDPGPSASGDKSLHGYKGVDSVSVVIPLNGPSIAINESNEAVVDSITDCLKILRHYQKLLNKWLRSLSKFSSPYGERILKELIDLKADVSFEIERCGELHLPKKQKRDEKESDSESDDFIDVPEKDGLELDFKYHEDVVPKHILNRINVLESECLDQPGPSGLPKKSLQAPPENSNGCEIPTLPFGLDLKYWGDKDIAPAEIPRNNSDCHRFWRPSDDSDSVNRDQSAVYHERILQFVGKPLQTNRACRTPLKDGSLCPRKDLYRCPVHGPIIDRDEMGFPVKPLETQTRPRSKFTEQEEEEYIRDVEAATGAELHDKSKKGHRRWRTKKRSLTSAQQVRQRLAASCVMFFFLVTLAAHTFVASVELLGQSEQSYGKGFIDKYLSEDARYCSAIAGGTAMSLSSVREANIDPQGTFKYILIKVQDKTNKNEKLIVRGYKKCPYHMDIFDETSKELPGYNLECLGGGRIKHDPTKKEILVYGYSQGYGKADHQKSVDILKKQLPDYKITFSDEGY